MSARAARRAAAPGLALVLLAGCAPGFFDRLFHRAAPTPPPPPIRFVVGEPYQTGGVWRYPRADYTLVETGLAAVAGAHGPLATDNERYDPDALAAAHRTLQLPAIARITDLDTGRSVVLRINDRGPAAPGRTIELTPRAALLLGAQDGARVRIQVVEDESRRLATSLQGTGPRLDVATAPRASVAAEALPPPPGARGSTGIAVVASPIATAGEAAPPAPVSLPRMAEEVTQGPALGGLLYVDAGAFGQARYARILQDRLVGLGAFVTTDYAAPRDRAYLVRLGPFGGVAEADATLDRALRAGVTDARISVGPPTIGP